MKLFKLFLLICISNYNFAQSIKGEIKILENQKSELQTQIKKIDKQIVDLKHTKIIKDLKIIGLPSDNYIEHAAMILCYAEEHEQARWVSHIILPDVKDGKAFRSNDFRIDPKVTTGTAIQEDYFLTDTLENGIVEYDGFGYDRGHLAPSADFRWSPQALSESYYYSNMSPQLPEFNREKWAELESYLRKYVSEENTPLYIVTLPILKSDLNKIERSINKVSIPNQFAKVAYDPINKRAIGFLMANDLQEYPLEHYAQTVDSIEAISGLNLFKNISESIESKIDKKSWFKHIASGDHEPIAIEDLPKGCFNTIQAGKRIGKETTVCGQVVATRFSRKGHLWMNVDKQFPNQIFSIFVRKENLVNFESDLKTRFINQAVCVKGKVENFSDAPSISLSKAKDIALFKR